MKFEQTIKTTSIDELNDKLNTVSYDRGNVTAGILHIGVCDFHRSHEQYYTNELLNTNPTQSEWGICGVMLQPEDKRLYDNLVKQGGLYTVTVCGCNGINICHEIGSLVELILAYEDPNALIERIADPKIRIISINTMEIANPAPTNDIFEFLEKGLRLRRDSGSGQVTILSCDNLPHNGDNIRDKFISYLTIQNPTLIEWVVKNVSFPNSMVDRITPVTQPDDVKRLNRMNGTNDAAPIYCEDFSQWVIEDKFIAGRPEWEKVGVIFTDDVSSYENMKLNLLNASHTLLSYPSYLCGYRNVDDAMHDERIIRLIRNFMDIDMAPYIQAPGGIDPEIYKQTLIERFSNRTVNDQIARLCSNGMSKFPIYITPNLEKMIQENRDLTRIAYLLAAYRHYLKYRHDDNGVKFTVDEPYMTAEDYMHATNEDPMDFLNLSILSKAGLGQCGSFISSYNDMVSSIYHNGAMATLEHINNVA